MPILKNAEHERFARLLSQGLNQTEAFLKIRPNVQRNSAPVTACHWAARLDVKTRLAEIREVVDSQFAMLIGEKRDMLRRMALGEVPTKINRKANGQVEATFDRLAALQADAKLGGEYAPEQHVITTGPTLKLEFNMVGRNTNMTPALEEEWKMLNAPPEVRTYNDAVTIDAEVEKYEFIEVGSKNPPSLKTLSEIIDEVVPD
jgi:hypothetical protein